jgi:hypothetical protein
MSDEPGQRPDVKKRPYAKPVLRVYGQVRDLTGGTNGSQSGDAQVMVMGTGSDRRVKRNIVRVGDHPLGVGLYLFDYDAEHAAREGRGRQFGVMADEVEAVMPAAVAVGPDGYKRVDYGLLGISRPRR